MTVVAMAADLVRWFQLLCFDGQWRNARPKAMRWGIFHAPGRLSHRSRQRVACIIDGWPGTDALLGDYRRIEPIARSDTFPAIRHQRDEARHDAATRSSLPLLSDQMPATGPQSLPNHLQRGSGNPIHGLSVVSRLLVNGAG